MAYVRKKLVKGQTYHYLVESHWTDGKPRQKVLAYLGTHATVRKAYTYWKRESQKQTNRAAKRHAQQMVKTLKQHL